MDEKDQISRDLPGNDPAINPEAVKAAKEVSEVAKLSAEVIELGLVREGRPVFVYDKKLALEKKGNAARQEKFRAEREKEGLKMGLVPVAALEKVKELGGGSDGWTKYIASLSSPKNETKEVLGSGGVERVEVIKEVFVEKEIIKEVPIEVFVEKIIEKEVIKEVPGPVQIQKVEVEKVVFRMSEEEKKAFLVGKKVDEITGFRRKLINFLLRL